MTAKQFRNMKGNKKNKYNAKKVYIDGYTFDSKREGQYYNELKMQKRLGEIKGFELQPEFLLQEKFKKHGKTQRAIKYIADFKVYHLDGSVQVIDCKGHKTQVYRLKKKMFEYHYPDLTITEVL